MGVFAKKKGVLKILATVVAVAALLVLPVVFSTVPALAADDSDCVKTSILGKNGEYCDDGEGGGVYEILSIVLNVLTIGVGVLGVLGIVISGIQYATAADNEQQMAKAKQRIIEVVIGLVIYAVMYAVLQWLIPGGIFGGSK